MGNGITGNRLGVVFMAKTGNTAIDALFSDDVWAVGADRTITYSFPGAGGATYSLGPNYPNAEANNIVTPSASFQSNFALALGAWAAVANIKFAQVTDDASGAGDIRAFITNQAPTTNSGFARLPYSATRTAAAAGDIVFYNQLARDSSPGTFNYTTILHELGHTLGLKHPGNYTNGGSGEAPYLSSDQDNSAYSVMSYNFSSKISGYLVGPSLYDIQAMQYLYGANMDYAPGDQTYALSTANAGFRTIWDPNGKNTLSGAGLSSAQILNAQELSFSSAGSLYTAAVAKGTKISNLVGGSGNDQLIGNALDNSFTGGKGDDAITSGGGVDTAIYSGRKANYTVSLSGASYVVKDLTAGGDGTDTLTGVSYLAFSDGTVAIDAVAGAGTTLNAAAKASSAAVAAAYPIGVAIADQLTVVYLGRGVSASWRDATAPVVASGASDAMVKAFYAAAVADRAFSESDGLPTLVNKTFLNIFGIAASAFEQGAWADVVNAGYVSREALPWAMFNSYLGATNVPDSYKIPAQSRIIAANAFTNYIGGSAEAALGAPGALGADIARSWLLTIRSQSDAAAKASGAATFIANLTNTGATITGTTAKGALEGVDAGAVASDASGIAGSGGEGGIPLVGVHEGTPFS